MRSPPGPAKLALGEGARLRHLLYNLARFNLFGCNENPDWLLYVAGAGESVAVGAAGLVTDMITSPTALAKQDQGGVAISHDPAAGSPRGGEPRDSSETHPKRPIRDPSPRPSTDSLAMEVESGSNGEGGGSMEVEGRPTDKERKKQEKQRRKEEKRQKKRKGKGKGKDPPPMEEVANPLTEAEDANELET